MPEILLEEIKKIEENPRGKRHNSGSPIIIVSIQLLQANRSPPIGSGLGDAMQPTKFIFFAVITPCAILR